MDAARQAMESAADNIILFMLVLVGLYALSAIFTLAMERGLKLSRSFRGPISSLLFLGLVFLAVTNGMLPTG